MQLAQAGNSRFYRRGNFSRGRGINYRRNYIFTGHFLFRPGFFVLMQDITQVSNSFEDIGLFWCCLVTLVIEDIKLIYETESGQIPISCNPR